MEQKKEAPKKKVKKQGQTGSTSPRSSSAKKAKPKGLTEITSWIEKLFSAGKIEKAVDEAQHLPKTFQPLAQELIQAITSIDAKPGNAFKVELLSHAQITRLIHATANPFFLINVLSNNSTSRSSRQEVITKLSTLELKNQHLEYLLAQLQRIKDTQDLAQTWNSLLEKDIYKNATSKTENFDFLEWGINKSVIPANNLQYLFALGLTDEDFAEIEKSKRNRFLHKLLELNPSLFWGFTILIGKKSISREELERFLGKDINSSLLTFFQHRKEYSGPWLTDFEQKLLVPLLKSHADRIMTFDVLLPFLKYLEHYRSLEIEEWLARAVKRSFGRGDDLAELLADKRVDGLNRDLEKISTRNAETEAANRDLSAKVKQLEATVSEYKQAVENYENLLRENMKAEASSSTTDIARIRAEFIKNLVEALDGILDGPLGSELERTLQRLGISRLGKVGADYAWDAETCETLLGDAITMGVVVRSGYTWLNGSSKILIRRVLLKSQ